MHSAIAIRDGVRKTLNVLGVRVRILENHVDVTNLGLIIDQKFPHPADGDRRRMNQLFGLAKFPHILGNPLLVKKDLAPARFYTLICQVDLQSLVQKGEFSQSGRKNVELKFGREGEYFGIRQKGNESAGKPAVLDFANHFEFSGGLSPGERNEIDFTVSSDFGFEPLGEGVNAFGTNTVETAGKFVSALPKFASRMQVG